MAKHFSEVIAGYADGDLDARITKRWTDLTKRVNETGGTGSLTITLKVTKHNRQVDIKPAFKATMPEAGIDRCTFFVADDGDIVRDDPAQLKLPRVGAAPARIVSIGDGRKDES